MTLPEVASTTPETGSYALVAFLALIAIILAACFAVWRRDNPANDEEENGIIIDHTNDHAMPQNTQPEALEAPEKPTRAEVLYGIAYACLGQDLTPRDQVSDEFACVVQLEAVIYKAFGYRLGGENPETNTWGLLALLQKDPRWQPISAPQKGCIILNVTGSGNGKIHGHCGIVGNTHVMSNTSANGLWQANYTLSGWKARFETQGAMHTHYFLPL